jgi:MSHA pilin protein MshD
MTRGRGFTLVELVVFIAIVGIALAGVLAAFDYAVRGTADPVVRKQALAIGESLLQEVQQMPFTFCDPDDPQASTAQSTAVGPTGCSSAAGVENPGPEAGESRYSAATPFDNVSDYHGYDTAAEVPPGVKDISNTPIAGLEAYNARVTVADAALPGVPAGEAVLITVVVDGPANVSVRLDGYRARYAPQL